MKNLKKALAVSCAGLLLFAPYNYPVFPEILTAYADTTFDLGGDIYGGIRSLRIDASGNYTITGTAPDSHNVVISADCTVTLSSVNIDYGTDEPALKITSGNVVLVLDGTSTLNGWAGIRVESGASLTIQGSGTLKATGSCAGIGVLGSLTIAGGTIEATGGSDAGIGATNEGGGNVTIKGGVVTAKSTGSGADIGKGALAECNSVKIENGANVHVGISATDHIKASSVSIASGAIVNGCEYPPNYTITIPSDITFDPKESAEVKVSDVNIEEGKKISVAISSKNVDKSSSYNHSFYLKDESNEDNKLLYAIYYKSGVLSAEVLNKTVEVNGEKILSVEHGGTDATATLGFELKDDIKYAGSYTDTLTFTVSMENK